MEYSNLILFAAGMLGVLIHNLVKINQLNRKQGGKFNFSSYLSMEWAAVLLSICVLAVALIAKHEIKQLEQAQNYLALFFCFTGYAAQSLVIAVLGKAEKSLKNEE